jgi:ABC-2 type transport system permease protein
MILQLVLVITIVSMSLSGLGLLVASRMQSQQGFQVVIQLIIMPLIFLAGVFYPVNNVPIWMEVISKVNPLTYGVDAIRQIFLGSEGTAIIGVTVFGHTMTILEDVLIVAAFGAVFLSLAVWSFSRQN